MRVLLASLTASATLTLAACGSDHATTSPDGATATDAASSVDAPAADASSGACAGTYCEDFESYPAGAITNGATLGPWTVKTSGTITLAAIDSVKPHSGARALHITVPAGTAAGATLYMLASSGLVPTNNLYGRAMVYFSDATGFAAPIGVHSWLFQGLGNSPTSGGAVSMNWGDGAAKMQLNYHPATTPEQSVQGIGQMAAGAWHCLQWQYDGSGTPPANAATVWLDSAVAVSVPQTKGWEFATPWNAFNFGFMHYQTITTATDVYLDDLVIGDAMIACP